MTAGLRIKTFPVHLGEQHDQMTQMTCRNAKYLAACFTGLIALPQTGWRSTMTWRAVARNWEAHRSNVKCCKACLSAVHLAAPCALLQ